MSKTCPQCCEVLPEDAFGRNRSRPDGLSFYCLACNRRRNNRWYQERRRSLGHEVRDHSWVPDGFRWCPLCRQAVAHADYSRSPLTTSGFGSRCRACKNAASSDAYFYRTYGLTRRALEELRQAQGDCCALCGDSSPQHLDHDHATGEVRQLLCQRCNHALGLFRDDPAVLRAAADYVERHRRQGSDPARPLAGHRPEVSSRVQRTPVGSDRRPSVVRGMGSSSRGRARRAVREVDE